MTAPNDLHDRVARLEAFAATVRASPLALQLGLADPFPRENLSPQAQQFVDKLEAEPAPEPSATSGGRCQNCEGEGWIRGVNYHLACSACHGTGATVPLCGWPCRSCGRNIIPKQSPEAKGPPLTPGDMLWMVLDKAEPQPPAESGSGVKFGPNAECLLRFEQSKAANKLYSDVCDERDQLRHWLDEIAAALHPHWKGEGHTYLPEQLAGMVNRLRQDLGRAEERIRDLKFALGDNAGWFDRAKAAESALERARGLATKWQSETRSGTWSGEAIQRCGRKLLAAIEGKK